MSSYQQYLRIVHKLGGKDKNGAARCFCPCHEDTEASLDVKLRDTILIKCRANCTQDEIIERLREMGLWGKAAHPAEIKASQERAAILNATVSFFESVTPPEVYQWIEQKWGISEELARKHRLCWAPKSGLKKHLQSLGYSADAMIKLGLIKKPREGQTFYPQRFFKRVIFPTINGAGDVTFLEGRHITPDEGPGLGKDLISTPKKGQERKYIKLNAQVPLFSLRSRNSPLHFVVESHSCAIRLHEITGATVTALLTNALNQETPQGRRKFRELADLAHKHERSFILLDNQPKTQEKAQELAAQLSADGLPFVSVSTLPEAGQDPCEFLQEADQSNLAQSVEALFYDVPSYIEGKIQAIDPKAPNEHAGGFSAPSGAALMEQLVEVMRYIGPQAPANKLYFTELLRDKKVKVGQIKRAAQALTEETKQKLVEERARRPASDCNEWKKKIQWTQSGTIKQTVFNATLILTNDQAWRETLGWDDFLCAPCFLKQPDFAPEYAATKAYDLGASLEEEDYLHICNWLSDNYKVDLKPQTIAECLRVAAQQNRYHPIRDYLQTLKWDGIPRVATWLNTYMGAEEHEYVRMVGTWFMVASVARIMEPGCKMDNILILEGGQGKGKSTALHNLFNRKWVDDTQSKDISSKDQLQALRGKWLLEFAELDNVIKADPATSKAFFSSSVDRYRPPYAKQMVEYPRQCVFAGTVNLDEYLRDSTGGRRFWPVRTCENGEIQLDQIIEDRDQLWAEAVTLYQQGARWYPYEEREIAMCAEQQRRRSMTDAWEEPIRQYLNNAPGLQTITIGYVLRFVFNLEPAKWDRWSQTRVGKILSNLDGWEKNGRKMEDRSRVTLYRRVEQPTPEAQDEYIDYLEQEEFEYDYSSPSGTPYAPPSHTPRPVPRFVQNMDDMQALQYRYHDVGESLQGTIKRLMESMPLIEVFEAINDQLDQTGKQPFDNLAELAVVLATDYPLPY